LLSFDNKSTKYMVMIINAMECLFCNISKGRALSYKVWEDESHFAFLSITPINPGHIILIPKIHVGEIFNLSDNHFVNMFKAAKLLAGPLKQFSEAKRIGIAVEGLGVSHVHLHLVPIHYSGDLILERTTKTTRLELEKIQKEFKKQLVACR
jgi:histidine triad (HIT) family protein